MKRKNTPKLSVLVPCYNVERYLDECLSSIVNQTFTDMEIICINDGSKDGTLDIIKKYAKKDKRIVIIDKENEGYGKSMNRGLDAANGEYIGIVESDDWIDKNMYEVLITAAEQNDVDVVKANFFEYTTFNGVKNKKRDLLPEWDCGVPFCPQEKTSIFFVQPSIWSAVYKRDFLEKNEIRFLESPGASYQDVGFNFKVWMTAKKVLLLNDAFLHYRCDNENASVKSKGKVFCVTDEWNAAEQYLKDKGLLTIGAKKIIAHAKLGNYLWNLNRLEGEEYKAFLRQFQKEYSKYISDKLVEKIYFDDKTWNKLLCALYPDSKLKQFRKHFFDLIRPIYKTRVIGGYKKWYLFNLIHLNKKRVPDLKA